MYPLLIESPIRKIRASDDGRGPHAATSLMVVIVSEFPSSTSGNHLIVRLAHLEYQDYVAHMCMRPSYGMASRALSQFVVSAFRLSGRGVF